MEVIFGKDVYALVHRTNDDCNKENKPLPELKLLLLDMNWLPSVLPFCSVYILREKKHIPHKNDCFKTDITKQNPPLSVLLIVHLKVRRQVHDRAMFWEIRQFRM